MRWLWRHYGDYPAEADVLERLVAQRLHDATEGDGPGASTEMVRVLEEHEAFLRFRFGGHLRNYRTFAGKYNLAFRILSITTIASGFLWAEGDNWKMAAHHDDDLSRYYLGRVGALWDHLAVSIVTRDRHWVAAIHALPSPGP